MLATSPASMAGLPYSGIEGDTEAANHPQLGSRTSYDAESTADFAKLRNAALEHIDPTTRSRHAVFTKRKVRTLASQMLAPASHIFGG